MYLYLLLKQSRHRNIFNPKKQKLIVLSMPKEQYFSKSGILFICLEAISIIAWAFLLSSSGFVLKNAMLVSGMDRTISSVLGWQFILFLAVFPLTFGLIAIQARLFEKKQLLINAYVGVLAGGIVSVIAFPGLRQYWLIGIFYLIAVYLCIVTAGLNFLELKKWVLPRAMMNSMEKATIALGIGVFLSLLLWAYSGQAELVKDFENEIMAKAGATPENLADASATMLVQANTQFLGQLASSPQYSALKASQSSAESQDFVAFIQNWETQAKSPEYKDALKQQVMAQNKTDVISLVKQRVPFFETLTQWYWLLIAISLTSIFFFAASMVFRPLCALYGMVLGAVAGKGKQ